MGVGLNVVSETSDPLLSVILEIKWDQRAFRQSQTRHRHGSFRITDLTGS